MRASRIDSLRRGRSWRGKPGVADAIPAWLCPPTRRFATRPGLLGILGGERLRLGREVGLYSNRSNSTRWERFRSIWDGRESRLRRNNDRLRRRMAEKGLRLDFAAIRDPAQVGDAIVQLARLESKGWKAKEGTAVSVDNAQGRFYQALLEHFCARDEGVIYQLRIDDQVVATDICVTRGEMLVLSQDSLRRGLECLFPRVSASRRHRSGAILRRNGAKL